MRHIHTSKPPCGPETSLFASVTRHGTPMGTISAGSALLRETEEALRTSPPVARSRPAARERGPPAGGCNAFGRHAPRAARVLRGPGRAGTARAKTGRGVAGREGATGPSAPGVPPRGRAPPRRATPSNRRQSSEGHLSNPAESVCVQDIQTSAHRHGAYQANASGISPSSPSAARAPSWAGARSSSVSGGFRADRRTRTSARGRDGSRRRPGCIRPPA